MTFEIQRFAEFATAHVGTLKMKLATNANGNIAQSGETAAGQKAFTLNGFKAKGSLDEANVVFGKIFGNIAGGNFDSLSAEKTVTQGVAL